MALQKIVLAYQLKNKFLYSINLWVIFPSYISKSADKRPFSKIPELF